MFRTHKNVNTRARTRYANDAPAPGVFGRAGGKHPTQQNLQEIEVLDLPCASKQRFGVNPEEFIQQLTSSSENNFMYVSQILTAIKTGFYPENSSLTDILDRTSFPSTLETYYQQHLHYMFPGEEANSTARAVLNALVQNSPSQHSSPLSVEEISQIIDADEYDVEEVLENWIEFLTLHQIDGDCKYSLYHANFRNWLSTHSQRKSL